MTENRDLSAADAAFLRSTAVARAKAARAARLSDVDMLAPDPRPETIAPEDQLALKSSLDQLPELTPARKKTSMGDWLSTKGIRFSHASAADEETDFRAREEAANTEARLTVYALNGALLMFAFPVGFAMLIFNILGGENLRTTAHAMALTGMGIALSYTELGQRIINSI